MSRGRSLLVFVFPSLLLLLFCCSYSDSYSDSYSYSSSFVFVLFFVCSSSSSCLFRVGATWLIRYFHLSIQLFVVVTHPFAKKNPPRMLVLLSTPCSPAAIVGSVPPPSAGPTMTLQHLPRRSTSTRRSKTFHRSGRACFETWLNFSHTLMWWCRWGMACNNAGIQYARAPACR